LRLSKVTVASFVAMMLISTSIGAVYLQNNTFSSYAFQDAQNQKMFIFSVSLIAELGVDKNLTFLSQSTRMKIYNFVKNNPGVHFRGICDSLSMPIGVAQYHLGLLAGVGLLSVHLDGRYKRYFESQRFGEDEVEAISLLRHDTSRNILVALMENQFITHKNLASRLKISSQALSWQMKHLQNMGFVKSAKEGLNVKYFIEETRYTLIKRCLSLLEMK
jgi:predicted transcriptional regulator